MTSLVLGALLTIDKLDSLFQAHARAELRIQPRREKPSAPPLDPALFALPEGDWYPAERVQLSPQHTGYVVFETAGRAWLIVVERASKRVTDRRVVAAVERLDGAYEKTTSSRLAPVNAGWELTTSVFLHDFEKEAPGAPNTTGTTTVVRRFSRGAFVER